MGNPNRIRLDPYEAAFAAALEDLRSSRLRLMQAEEDAASARADIERLERLVHTLGESLTPEKRDRTLSIAKDKTLTQSDRGSDTFNKVVRLFQDRDQKVWRPAEVRQALEEQGVPVDAKAVHNVLHYLERQGRLERVRWGVYRISGGAIIEVGHEIPGAWPGGGYDE